MKKWGAWGVLLGLVACQAQSVDGGSQVWHEVSKVAWSAPPLDRVTTVFDGKTGREIDWPTLMGELAAADTVFLGETHLDETTHCSEEAIYRALLEQHQGKVVLAMEMFERDLQTALDDYLSGSIDEATFRERARFWGNYDSAYRPLIEAARTAGAPVVASNFPLSVRRQLAMEGEEAITQLQAEGSPLVPADLRANTPDYWRRVDNAVRGHIGMMGGPADPDDPRLTATQSLWDNAMGEACAKALADHPGHAVLHVNGGFHSEYWDGTVRQFRLRAPHARVRTVAMVPVGDPRLAEVRGAPVADFVIFTKAVARDLDEGKWSVQVDRAVDYRLHLPEHARREAPVPLLVWWNDDGLEAAEGIALWKSVIGEEAAILVLEPLYPAIAEDLARGGRWFWPDSFAEDLSVAQQAAETAIGYVARHFPVDPNRLVLAGEGSGATVVALTTLHSVDYAPRSLAFAPRGYLKIKDQPLPLPEERPAAWDNGKSLRVYPAAADEAWWQEEISAYRQIGLDAAAVTLTTDPWQLDRQQIDAVRKALGLDQRAPGSGRFHLLLDELEGRGRVWARSLARARGADAFAVFSTSRLSESAPPELSASTVLNPQLTPEALRQAGALPPCPGPFGGTTVLVVTALTDAASRAAYAALVEDDPLTKQNRFTRLRVVTGEAGATLPEVLQTLHGENRRNVLIVPLAFHAGATTMRRLRDQASPWAEKMTLHWLPGLGAPTAE